MENFVQNFSFKDRLGRKVLLFLIPILLFNIQNALGQATPCASPIVYFLKTEGTSTDAALDGKIKLYGDVIGTNKVVVSTTALAAPTGNTEFTNAALFSSFTNGYVKTNAPNSNQTYYIRVYSADGLCYTDNTINFEKTNFTAVPTQPDIMVDVSHTGGAFPLKNALFNAVITVQNDGTATATGLAVTVVVPAGMTVVTPTASSGTYNPTTGIWTIPTVLVGAANKQTLTFTNTSSTTEGVKFISANLTAEAQTDKDSSPTTNNAGEDDQDVACVSTPYELCNGNKIDITLAASNTSIVWKKNTAVITGTAPGQYAIVGNTLTIYSIGEYEYTSTSTVGSCPTGGCCPIKVIAAPLPLLSLAPTPVSCFGGNDGTITATATSGTTPYEFSKNGTAFQSSGVFNTLTAGTYTITAKDVQGCTATATTTITQPAAALAVSISPVAPAICNGQSVNLNATATGGTAPYTYTWSASLGTGASKTVSPTATTIYSVSVVDGKNCAATATVNVTVNQTPIASAPAVAALCAGGTINLTSSNTNAAITTGLSYSWSGPASFTSTAQNPSRPSATVAMGGVYTVTITSATGGCTSTATVNVTVNQTPIASAPAVAALCAGGTINLTSSNTNTAITTGLSYAWSGPNGFTSAIQNPSIASATVAAGGVYTVTITSATGGCTSTATVNVTVNQTPIASAPAVAAICAGGTINLTSSNTNTAITTGLSYAWSGPNGFTSAIQNPSIASATVAAGGVYTVTIISATGGCTSTATVNVTVNQTPIASAPAVAAICAGGTINLTSSNTNTAITTGLSYSWSGPASFSSTLQNPSRTSATVAMGGVYTVTITSATGGCTSTATVNVTVNQTPIASAPAVAAICAGGTINLTSSNTNTAITTGLSYSWSGPASFSSTLQNPSRTSATVAMGGVYTVTITSATGGCTSTATVNVTVNQTPIASAPAVAALCAGGTINLTSSNTNTAITTGLSYAWSGPNGFTSAIQNPSIASATVAAGGVYTVTITSATGGCTSTATVNVTVNQTPIASAPAVAALCAGGTINLTSSNTNTAITTGLSYSWSGPASFSSTLQNPSRTSATVAMGGVYTVTITSATGGCTSTATVNVTVNQTPIASAPAVAAICAGGTINLTSSNTNTAITTGLSYAWSGPNGFTSATQNPSIASATVAAGGVYTVTITSATGGCTSTATVNVTVNQTPIASAPAVAALCAGGTINLTSSNTNTAITTGLSYAWSGPNGFTSAIQNPSIASATVAAGGVYTVTITSATGGCTSTATVNVTVNQTPIALAPAVAAICAGGTINLTSSNTNTAITTGLSYSWSGPASFSSTLQNPSRTSATVAMSGVYTVTITSATGGCTSTATVNVTVNQTPIASAPAVAAICAGGTINLTSSNTNTAITTGLSYAWSGPNGFTSAIQNPSIASATVAAGGVYTVTITSATGGCTSTATVNVTVNQTPIASAPAVAAICAGGTINLTSSNTNTAITTGLSYAWSGPNGFTSAIQNPNVANATVAAGGIYTVTITSATGGCTSTATVNVTVNQTPIASAPAVAAICAGGTINLTSSNTNTAITTGLTYSWSGPASFSSTLQNPSRTSATVAMGGIYTVTITSGTGGCTSTATVNVTVNQTPIASAPAVAAICAGGTINLTSSNTNTAITTGLSYAWSGPNGFTSVIQNPNVANATVAAGGVYTVTITSATGGCTSTATVNVTVNQTPIASAPAVAAICAGGTINLTSSNTNTAITSGLSYAWAGPNGFTSAIQNPNVANATVAAGGIYTVTITSVTGGCTSTATVNVTVNQTPIASAPVVAAICAGGTINLTSSNTNTAITTGLSYSWSGPASFSSTLQNPSRTSATVAMGGVYTVTISSATGGCTSTATVNVTVNQTPIATATGDVECVGSTVNLTSANTNTAITSGLTYAWSGPNSFTSNTQNPAITSVTAAAGGVYTVTITSGTGGCTATATVNVTINPLPTATLAAPAACAGATTVLTPTGLSNAATFLWSTGATTSSISVNPTVPTGYTLTVTSASSPACSITRTVWLDVKALPTAEVTVIPSSCIGSVAQGNGQLMLNKYRDSDQVAYGSPISATPTFANVPAGGIFATGLPNTAATYTIRLKNTITNCTNDLTATTTATVCPCPAGYCEPATVVKTK